MDIEGVPEYSVAQWNFRKICFGYGSNKINIISKGSLKSQSWRPTEALTISSLLFKPQNCIHTLCDIILIFWKLYYSSYSTIVMCTCIWYFINWLMCNLIKVKMAYCNCEWEVYKKLSIFFCVWHRAHRISLNAPLCAYETSYSTICNSFGLGLSYLDSVLLEDVIVL